jgi:hypothetical protein
MSSKWILVPGRIQKSKGQTLIFDIMKELSTEELSKLHFVIIGAPTKEDDRLLLEKLFLDNHPFQNSISYLGFQANPLDWMIASDGIMLLSEFEGFPLVPLESIGLGIPTLLSHIPPHLFLKENATLTSLTDLKIAINWVRERIKFSDRDWDLKEKFRKDYGINKMTLEYLSLYKNKKEK